MKVQITETLQRIILVEATNETEALELIQEDYREGTYVLDSSDLTEVKFEIVTEDD